MGRKGPSASLGMTVGVLRRGCAEGAVSLGWIRDPSASLGMTERARSGRRGVAWQVSCHPERSEGPLGGAKCSRANIIRPYVTKMGVWRDWPYDGTVNAKSRESVRFSFVI